MVACGLVVNASGPRAAVTAAMAGLEVPVEPRKRFTWMFSAAEPLDQDLPLTTTTVLDVAPFSSPKHRGDIMRNWKRLTRIGLAIALGRG